MSLTRTSFAVPPIPGSWKGQPDEAQPSSATSTSTGNTQPAECSAIVARQEPHNHKHHTPQVPELDGWAKFPDIDWSEFDFSSDEEEAPPRAHTPRTTHTTSTPTTPATYPGTLWTNIVFDTDAKETDPNDAGCAFLELADVQLAFKSDPLDASHHGISRNVKKNSAGVAPKKKTKQARKTALKQDAKNIHSRAYHKARTTSLAQGKSAEEAKDPLLHAVICIGMQHLSYMCSHM